MNNNIKLSALFNESKRSNESNYENISIALVSNITLEPFLKVFLETVFLDKCMKPCIHNISFQEYFLEENYFNIANCDIIIVWLNYDALCSDLKNDFLSGRENRLALEEVYNVCIQLFEYLKKNSIGKIIWFSFEDMYSHTEVVTGYVMRSYECIDYLNLKLFSAMHSDVILIDLKKIISCVGIENAYDYRSKYMWNSPYSRNVIQAAANQIYKQYLIMNGITKKCIVLDCDNVLWGGVIAEEGIENIKLGPSGIGRSFQELQRFLLTLYYHGIILTVCSKNELEDVLMMFREHDGMILREEHIACFQVNWENKASNIIEISNRLNISLDSIIFIDDSIFEIELVKSILPDVTSILYDRKTIFSQFKILNQSYNINTENIKKRNETYKTNEMRRRLEFTSKTYNDYLDNLKTLVTIKETDPAEYNRISELTIRTNKFTNGKRYMVSDIKRITKEDNYYLYSIFVSDKYSDLGLVGAIGIENNKIDLFCLSCRALGRNIEKNMIEFINERHVINESRFVSTGKNDAIKNLLLIYNKK